jgi:hypothetical protein
MADFLTRLAGRTLGVVPTVQPMIAPMFAPDSALLADQTGLPVFEEVSRGAPGQPSFWPARQESINLPGHETLQAAPAAEALERGANVFGNSTHFSLRQDTTFPMATGTQTRAAQPALPRVSDDISVNSHDPSLSIFVSGEEGQQDSQIAVSSTFMAGEGDMPATAHHIPLSSTSMTGEAVQPDTGMSVPSQFFASEGGVPGVGTLLPSQFFASEGGRPGADISLSLSATQLPAPDKTSPSQMREVHALPSQPVQGQLGRASSSMQDHQGSDVSHTVMHVNSIEGQGATGSLHQPTLSEESHSRASMRWAAADATTTQHELSQEGAAPTTPAAPTIQVKIGRIEVRATQPSPVPRQVQRQGPRMVSLEEYLNQQAKGGQ